jgi:hypothetical protein
MGNSSLSCRHCCTFLLSLLDLFDYHNLVSASHRFYSLDARLCLSVHLNRTKGVERVLQPLDTCWLSREDLVLQNPRASAIGMFPVENDVMRRCAMKRLLSAAVLAIVLLPFAAPVARAEEEEKDRKKEKNWKEEQDWKKDGKPARTRATEMATLGLASAVVVGGAGYLILRRRTRKATQP